MSSRLDSAQSDWVETRIKEGFEPSKAVNSVLLGKSGVPAMSKQDEVIHLAQAELAGKKEAVDFMMRAEQGKSPVFTYQTKLVAPNNQRVQLAKALLNGQPGTMGTPGQPQQDVQMWRNVKEHLAGCPSRVVTPTWYWEFGQGDQVIEALQNEWSIALTDRAQKWLRSLPAGMRGTDLSTWATRMAAGIRDGKPLDVRFMGNATDTTETEEWNSTILEEEGLAKDETGDFLFVGTEFDPDDRRAALHLCRAAARSDRASFRAAIDGTLQRF